MPVPPIRIRALNSKPTRSAGEFVLYWMTAFRRATSNFSLDRAVEHAVALKKPLVICEPVILNYPSANLRLHTFILEGMAENQRRFSKAPVLYLPFVETEPGQVSALFADLNDRACVTVTDDWPCFFVPKMHAGMAKRSPALLEAVDSNGLYPMHDTDRVFTTAHSFRTHLQKQLAPHLRHLPREKPFAGLQLPQLTQLPGTLHKRWSGAPAELLAVEPAAMAALKIDHSVPPAKMRGGSHVAEKRLKLFVTEKLKDYATARNEAEVDGTSALSPYLHFGHLSTHQIFTAIVEQEKWSPDVLGKSIGGSKAGWWHLSDAAESFIDELVTWRELAFNMTSHRPDDYGSLSTLPAWAQQTHKAHANDPRKYLYTREQLEQGRTHDRLWNATQMQMVRDGWFHNYLRMLWGKKILEWSKSPQDAFNTMESMMNRYSLDGRDPCSYSGYMWVLGRYDRAWGPERPIFGKVRYMSSDSTAKKMSVKNYIQKYHP